MEESLNGELGVVDPCIFEIDEVYENVTVEILKCKSCGKVSVGWKLQPNSRKVEGSNDTIDAAAAFISNDAELDEGQLQTKREAERMAMESRRLMKESERLEKEFQRQCWEKERERREKVGGVQTKSL